MTTENSIDAVNDKVFVYIMHATIMTTKLIELMTPSDSNPHIMNLYFEKITDSY
jgi:hypothetical protein